MGWIMGLGNNSYRQEKTMQDGWVKIGVLGCNSVRPRNVNEPPTGEGTAVGNAANAATADSLAVGDGAAAHGQKSVAIGSGSVASNDNECSVGAPATESAAEYTREIKHVSEPTAASSAATKGYVDGSINVIAPKTVATAAVAENGSIAIGEGAVVEGKQGIAIGKSSKAIGLCSISVGYNVQSVGKASVTNGIDTVCTGNNSFVFGYNSSICATQCVAIGSGAFINGYKVPDVNVKDFKASVLNSVAIGSFSVADENRVVSVGNDVESVTKYFRVTDDSGKLSETAPYWASQTQTLPKTAQHLKRRIIHVADPIDWHNAANKNYVDANTSNALTGTAYGNPTAHVEDAWPFKPLELAVAGEYKQGGTAPEPPIVEGDEPSPDDQVMMLTGADTSDASTYSQNGTPSPTNPVPIEVVENIVLRVTGADTSAEGASLPITLPAEHPYLAALPDGTRDEIVIGKDGNATLVARVGRDTDVREVTDVSVGQYFGLKTTLPSFASADAQTSDSALCSAIPSLVGSYGVYRTWNGVYIKYSGQEDKDQLQSVFAAAVPMTVFAPIPETRYPLGKLDIPALPETVSNVWVESNIATMVRMMYKRDINTLLDRDKLPIASTTNRGTVKVGHGLDVDADGTLWVTESDSIPLAQTVTVRTSEKNFAVTGSPKDVASHKALMPVFNCGGYYNTFGGYFYLDLKNSYNAGTTLHIELDVVWQDTHICSSIHRVAVVGIRNDTYTIPFGPSMYRGADYNWYYWSFDVPLTADVPAQTQIHVNVF